MLVHTIVGIRPHNQTLILPLQHDVDDDDYNRVHNVGSPVTHKTFRFRFEGRQGGAKKNPEVFRPLSPFLSASLSVYFLAISLSTTYNEPLG